MSETNTFETFIQEKITSDTEFQNSLADLNDEDKNNLIQQKKDELLRTEAPTWFENATKHEKAYNDTKTRAEKAEAALKAIKPPVTEKKQDDNSLSTKDFYALNKANVPEEDIDDVIEYAKFKNISVGDALKSSVVKATLADKAEIRRTANATTVRQTRSTNTRADGASVISDIKSKGEDSVPSAGSEDAEALFWARRGRKPQ